jgi:UDP-N-acetylglucosamine/UDP-N-acetylgalactosamine diphosphorylase
MSYVFLKGPQMSENSVDISKLAEQLAAIEKQKAVVHRSLMPVADPVEIPSSHPSPLLQGKGVGCVVMAGGQATRLGSSVPKGIIPFSLVGKKPLLQIIAEKVKAYARCYGIEPRLAIMTSEATDADTRALFEEHHFFGLDHVDFFVQPSLPLLGMDGKLIIGTNGRFLTGPDGNGSVFAGLLRSGIIERWERDGVKAMSIVMVDNPLLDPFCPALLTPIFEGVDMTAAAIERVNGDEKVGVFATEEDNLKVIEYSEIDPMLGNKRDKEGRLLFRWANISAFGCSMGYLRAAAALHLPLHVAKKNTEGHEVWKAEYFVFDAMAAARTIKLIPLVREECFAPIKDSSSFEKAGFDMMSRDRRRFFALTNVKADDTAPFELSASAYYPTDRFLTWLRSCDSRGGLLEEPSESSPSS